MDEKTRYEEITGYSLTDRQVARLNEESEPGGVLRITTVEDMTEASSAIEELREKLSYAQMHSDDAEIVHMLGAVEILHTAVWARIDKIIGPRN